MKAPAALLVEIGTEELPPSIDIPRAAKMLGLRLAAGLDSHGIWPRAQPQQFHTPRRLAVRVDDVPVEKPAGEVEVQGPPRKAAFDPNGKPTKTALGFSQAHGLSPERLYSKRTERGEYVFLRKPVPAVRTSDILREILPGVIAGLQLSKNMRWLEDKTRFPRPIRWLVCLLGDQVVPFEYAGLVAGRSTRGHRQFGSVPVELGSPADYEPALAAALVIVEPARRRAAVAEQTSSVAAELGAEPVLDEELVDETVGITENPTPVLCEFRPEHLVLPDAVIITALKKHQRCFALRGKDGRLISRYVAIADTPGCDQRQVARWYERASESRLEDALFYYQADTKRGLAALVDEEKRVTWIEGMGSYYDKTRRLRAICRHLAERVPGSDAATLERAAELAKADLLTDMVREKEFTSLQGVMGGIYARHQGESEEVAAAIAEQYLPVSASASLPTTRHGALLSIADKVDNIVATFLTGAIPTGSEDPFALRRQATAVLAIICEHQLPIDIRELANQALDLFENPCPDHAAKLSGFFFEREAQVLADRGIPYDIAEAVLASLGSLPLTALAAARALLGFRDRPEFEKLIVGQKRVANILRDQKVSGTPNSDLFAEPAELELHEQATAADPKVAAAVAAHDFQGAFELLLGLRPAIDRLFDDVLVMDSDDEVRTNRLRLLLLVRSLFARLADLSRIVIEGDAA